MVQEQRMTHRGLETLSTELNGAGLRTRDEPVRELHPGDPAGHSDVEVLGGGVLEDDQLDLFPNLGGAGQGTQLEGVLVGLDVARRVAVFVRFPT